MAGMTAEIDPLVERILTEGRLSMAAVSRKLGTFRKGRPVHSGTVSRWVLEGVRLPDGRILKLEAVRFNGALATSWAAVLRFISAQQGTVAPFVQETRESLRSPRQRVRGSDQAAEKLKHMGC